MSERRVDSRGPSGDGMLPSPLPADVAFVQATVADEGRFSLLPRERALLKPSAAERRILEFTLGRGCARSALASLHPALGEAPILRTQGRQPRWPEGAVGSITHHRGRAAAAAALRVRYTGLGLDLEGIRPLSAPLLQRLLRPEERTALNGLPGAERALRAMVVFSAKESIYKALNPLTGLYLGFQDATVIEAKEHPGQGRGSLRWRLTTDCGAAFPAGYEGVGGYTHRDGYVLSAVWIEAGQGG